MNESAITVLIADDEQVARKVIRHFLSQVEDFEVLGETADGISTLEDIERLKPQVVFLDIEMPEITGIELIGQLTPPLPLIVFVTAFDEYAIRAFEENAIDYILKPFDEERFFKSIDRIRQQLTVDVQKNAQPLNEILDVFEKLTGQQGSSKYLKKIACKQRGKIKFVSVEEIHWIESEGSFCKLHLAESFELTNLSIKKLEERLDPSTHLRIHKSHMINLDQIESIEPYFHGEYMINLKGGTTLKLSRGYKDRLESILNQYK